MNRSSQPNSATRASRKRTRGAQGGLSLIELMVSLVLGSVLMTGVIPLFISTKASYRFNTQMSQVQDNSRLALDILLADLRMAGFFGCSGNVSLIQNSYAVDDTVIHATSNVLEGIDNAADNKAGWLPSGAAFEDTPGTDDVLIVPGTDAITIRHLSGPQEENTEVNGSGKSIIFKSSDSLTVAWSELQDFPLAGITDCAGGEIFQVPVSNAAPTSNTISTEVALGRSYRASETNITMATPFIARRYFIGVEDEAANRSTPSDNWWENLTPSLYRTEYRLNNGAIEETSPQKLFYGAENLQFLYGMDTDSDGAADNYVSADALDAREKWQQVVSVRVAVLVRSLGPVGDSKEQDFMVLGEHAFADDEFRRRLFTASVSLRNTQ